MNYYNENDPHAAAWLRQLITDSLIPKGDVDDRSIVEVKPDDLKGYAQCHFFAGIGGWSYALQLAQWPQSTPVWTGSCPCQPFSIAGTHKGTEDERHLWPEFFRLIQERRPSVVLGEQVASTGGREWFAGIRADLEGVGYAVGGADLCAAGVFAPHVRQRLYWVADAEFKGSQGRIPRGKDSQRQNQHGYSGRSGSPSPWSDAVWLSCTDGKTRRIEPRIKPVASGVSGRVGLIRGYGNAIVPQVGALFISAYCGGEG